MFPEIRASLRSLYLDDPRPWLIGFSGGKDSTMVASLIFETVLALPPEQRKKEISVVCTDTRVEIPAIAETIEGTLEKMRQCSVQHGLKIDVNLLKPPAEESFWVNMIGRGYPPPNRSFRWCTQRLKIDPVIEFVTAFENRRSMQTFVSHIALESEVWIAEDPDHMIHFNGERFLGPYPDVMGEKS